MLYTNTATIIEGDITTYYKVMRGREGYSVYKKTEGDDSKVGSLFSTWVEIRTGFKDMYTAGQMIVDLIYRNGDVLV